MIYSGDGIWGCGLAAIASILGICAGCTNDRKVFKALYIAQATLVCEPIIFLCKKNLFFKNGLGIAVGLFAWIIAAAGIAIYFLDHYDGYMNWTLWGIWISEFLFIFGKCQIIEDPIHMGPILWANSYEFTSLIF